MRPGDKALIASVATVIAIDVVVIALTRDSISASVRRNWEPVVVGVAVLAAHVSGRPRCLAPYDPFRAVGAAGAALAQRVAR